MIAGESSTVAVGKIKDARRDLYRQQVLAAAEREFSRSGFSETKMSAIAQTANLSLATVYKTFSGKTEIWNDLHAERMKDLLAQVQGATRDSGTALDRLISGVATVALFLATHDAYLDLSIKEGAGWAGSTDHAMGVQKTVWSSGLDMIAEGLEIALSNEEVVGIRPSIAAGLVVSSLQVWLVDWVSSGRDRAPDEVVNELSGHLRRILSGPLPTTHFESDQV